MQTLVVRLHCHLMAAQSAVYDVGQRWPDAHVIRPANANLTSADTGVGESSGLTQLLRKSEQTIFTCVGGP